MPDQYTPLVTPPAAQDSPALWFAFQRGSILVSNAESAALPCCCTLEEHGVATVRHHYLGLLGNQHCYAAEIDEGQPLPAGWAPLGLRDLFGMVDSTLAALSGRALQIIDWERDHQFCSRCGTPMRARTDERARACPSCRFTSYPPVSPAVMVLITRGRELLLARKAVWPAGRYSAIAGFVEPGEMLEDTVVRETREEVGVEVGELRYFGSQPWPFPHSLMVAFTAEYAGGPVRPDGVEIEEAAWFDAEALPRLPPSVSISRRLITTVAAELARQYPR
ncbi:MAG: NAD(+) diphosphatase [Burkholderiales bacterium]|nr:NAD(+) diphosphatase [Burkholderiales bacterium]MCW5605834.1 NAD(+) diphosphatase [Burkholderiales bacterium]